MTDPLDRMDPKLAAKMRLAAPVLAIALGYWTPMALEAIAKEAGRGVLTGAQIDEVFDTVLQAFGDHQRSER